MTRHPIPFEKNAKLKTLENYRQSGIIAFTKKSLLRYNFPEINIRKGV